MTNTAPDNVTKLESAKSADEAVPQQIIAETQKDMGKAALIVSLLSVILLVAFFFGLNRNLTTVSEEVKALSSLKGEVATMGERVTELEKLPYKAKKAVMDSMLDEMATKAAYLGGQFMEPEQQEKLVQVQEVLRQVQLDLNAEK